MSGWAEAVPLSSEPERHLAPVAVEVKPGNYVVFWWQSDTKEKYSVLQMRAWLGADGGDMRSVVLVSGACHNRYPSAAANAGQIWLAWQADAGGGTPGIYVTRRMKDKPYSFSP
jgi:hypothetical protein